MRKKIYLYWYRLNNGSGNFGDELNPFIIERLGDVQCKFIDIELLNNDLWLAFRDVTYHLKHRKINFYTYIKYLYFNFVSRPKVYLAIGSVLQFTSYSNLIVWGSGTFSSDAKLPPARYLAVRGFKTIERLKQAGYKPPSFVGDPAILLPKIFKAAPGYKYKIGIIPHYIHFDLLKGKFSKDILVINMTDNIELILTQINNCELIVSTSLHGIIVSHAYGIKSIWAKYYKNDLNDGDSFKFLDYFSSVNIKEYQPIDVTGLFNQGGKSLFPDLNKRYNEVLIPAKERITQIQKDLLSVFPFKLKRNIEEHNE